MLDGVCGVHFQQRLAVVSKRLGALLVVRQEDVHQLLRLAHLECAPAGPDHELAWERLVDVEVCPSVAELSDKDINSSGRYPFRFPCSSQRVQERWATLRPFVWVLVEAKRIEFASQRAVFVESPCEIDGKGIQVGEALLLAAKH